MTFDNAPEGWIARGSSLRLTVRVESANAATIGVYVNGLRRGEPLTVTDGAARAQIPSSALVSDPLGPNCIALVARAADGTVVARNYALVCQVRVPGFLLEIR